MLTRINATQSTARVAQATTSRAVPAVDRRALLGAAASLIAMKELPALALLPNDEDEELVEKAKANRRTRLQQERLTERQFINTEGTTNQRLQPKLAAVQVAIQQLAIAGSKLKGGNAQDAAGRIQDSWVSEFKSAANSISTTDSTKGLIDPIFKGIDTFKAAASANKSQEARAAFVSTVASLQAWADATAISGLVKGL